MDRLASLRKWRSGGWLTDCPLSLHHPLELAGLRDVEFNRAAGQIKNRFVRSRVTAEDLERGATFRTGDVRPIKDMNGIWTPVLLTRSSFGAN